MQFTVDTHQHTIAEGETKAVSWFDDAGFRLLSTWWLQASWQRKYSYQFQWLGRPIIQQPADILMMQDLIYRIRPTAIIETGIAHGGSLVFSASMLHLVHRDSPAKPRVIGIDIEIRPHNRKALDQHPFRNMMHLIQSSSIAPEVIKQVRSLLRDGEVVLVVLDSNHLREHVRAELDLFSPLVTPGSAIVVMDGIMPMLADLPNGEEIWRTNNPANAVHDFLQSPAGKEFTVDDRYDSFMLTHSPQGILIRSAS